MFKEYQRYVACFAFILYWIERPRKALVLDPAMSVFTRPEPTRAYTHINIIWRKKENHGNKKSKLISHSAGGSQVVRSISSLFNIG